MPMKFSDLSRKTRPVTLDLGDGDTISGHYRHGLITPRLVHDVLALDSEHISKASAEDTADALDAVSGHTAALMADWDLLEDDGRTPYPLTVERLRDIPIHIQMGLIMACIGDMNAGEAPAPEAKSQATSAASGAGSSPKARTASRRSGTR